MHRISLLFRYDIVFPPIIIIFGIIQTAVGTAAFFAQQSRPGYCFSADQHIAKVFAQMPAGIKHPLAFIDAHIGGAMFEFFQFGNRDGQIFFLTEYAHQTFHHGLQIDVQFIGVFRIGAAKKSGHLRGGVFNLRRVDIRRLGILCVFRRGHAGAPSEDKQIGERIAAKTIGSVHTAGAFTGGI